VFAQANEAASPVKPPRSPVKSSSPGKENRSPAKPAVAPASKSGSAAESKKKAEAALEDSGDELDEKHKDKDGDNWSVANTDNFDDKALKKTDNALYKVLKGRKGLEIESVKRRVLKGLLPPTAGRSRSKRVHTEGDSKCV
jgi:hypothetical protein